MRLAETWLGIVATMRSIVPFFKSVLEAGHPLKLKQRRFDLKSMEKLCGFTYPPCSPGVADGICTGQAFPYLTAFSFLFLSRATHKSPRRHHPPRSQTYPLVSEFSLAALVSLRNRC